MWQRIGMAVLIGAITIDLVAPSGVAAKPQGLQTVNLQIEGMTCGACVKDVKASLAKLLGVSAVEMNVGTKWLFFSDYADVRVTVTFDPEKTGLEVLIKSIEAASSPLSAYKARLLKE